MTLCVHAGIAAADVICCARLDVHACGENRAEAVRLLAKAHAGSATLLRALLDMKTKAGCSALPESRQDPPDPQWDLAGL